jgi:hypothetical protein
MDARKRWFASTWCGLGALVLVAAVPVDTYAQVAAPAMDPAAVSILKRTTEFLDGLKQFSVRSKSIIEEMHYTGHRVDYDLAAEVTVKRPNKLRAMRSGELMDQRFFYDGTSLTLFNPHEKVFGSTAAPGTVDGMIDYARETVGVLLPAADLIHRNAFPLLMKDMSLAVVVGKASIDGVVCDHLLFSRPGVDFQIWVAEGDRPWPHKYVVTETSHPSNLSITTFLSDWRVDPTLDDAMFRFVPPKDAQAIDFIPVNPADLPGR